MSKTAIIIPARWASTRFPGKPLHPIAGKPLIQHVWERCMKCSSASQVIVATDDMRIAEAAFDFGAEVSITSPKHPSGTDRVAEVASRLKGIRSVINVQGDEPGIQPRLIDALIRALDEDRDLDMVTAACQLKTPAEAENPNAVKVVTGVNGRALYFSRSRIPFDRDNTAVARYWWHIGIYGYRSSFLAQFVKWKPTPLEKAEKLEQLRALEHGASIRVIPTKYQALGVDTPEDADIASQKLKFRK